MRAFVGEFLHILVVVDSDRQPADQAKCRGTPVEDAYDMDVATPSSDSAIGDGPEGPQPHESSQRMLNSHMTTGAGDCRTWRVSMRLTQAVE